MKTARVPDGFRALNQAMVTIGDHIFASFRYLYRLQTSLNTIEFSRLNSIFRVAGMKGGFLSLTVPPV